MQSGNTLQNPFLSEEEIWQQSPADNLPAYSANDVSNHQARPADPDSSREKVHVQPAQPSADTLIFVDVPKPAKGGSTLPADTSMGNMVLRFESKKLRSLKDSMFVELLDNPAHHASVRENRKPTVEMMQGINYLLDLTPSSADQVQETKDGSITVTPGIIRWCRVAQATNLMADASSFIEGSPVTEEEKAPAAPSDADSDWFKLEGPTSEGTYCARRHAVSILRLLSLIDGKPLTIDSADLAWTLTLTAKFFRCGSVARKPVCNWIASVSPLFVESLPEEALVMASCLSITCVAQRALRTLIAEEALSRAADTYHKDLTFLGRSKGYLPPFLKSLVDQIVPVFRERLITKFEKLPYYIRGKKCWDVAQWREPNAPELSNQMEAELVISRRRLCAMRALLVCDEVFSVLTGTRNRPPLHSNTFSSLTMGLLVDKSRVTYTSPCHFRPFVDIYYSATFDQFVLLLAYLNEIGFYFHMNQLDLEQNAYMNMEVMPLYRRDARKYSGRPAPQDFKQREKLATPSTACPSHPPRNAKMGLAYFTDRPLIYANRVSQSIVLKANPHIHNFVNIGLSYNEMRLLPSWVGGHGGIMMPTDTRLPDGTVVSSNDPTDADTYRFGTNKVAKARLVDRLSDQLTLSRRFEIVSSRPVEDYLKERKQKAALKKPNKSSKAGNPSKGP